MRTPEGRRLSVAVAVGMTALVLLVLAGPALTSAARKHLLPSGTPTGTPDCALVIGPIRTYCTPTAPAGSPR